MKFIGLFFALFFAVVLTAQEENMYEVETLPFCSEDYDEYNLVPYKKGAYFVSNHPSGGMKQVKDLQNNYLTTVYYQSNIKSRRTTVNKIDVRLKFHIGSFCLNDKKNFLVFTAQKSKEDLTLGLYMSKRKTGRWSKPKLIFDGYNEMNLMDPFMTPKGDTLFFVANMPGGKGGTDIYMATGELGYWTSLRGLEGNVNTAFNERYPKFYNNKLYYSSTRVYGNGGLDIYSIPLSNKGFINEPFHFPSPVNSDADDFAYCPIDEERGYFSSNRNGNDDIFQLIVNVPEFECFEFQKNARCFEFFEESDDYTDSTMYEFEWVFSDGAKYRGNIANHCFADTGDYIIELNLIDRAADEVVSNVASYEIEIVDVDQLNFLLPEKVRRKETIVLRFAKPDPKRKVSYYWDFGDGSFGMGRDVSHAYSRVGSYQVSLGEIEIIDGVPVKKCTSKIITVVQ